MVNTHFFHVKIVLLVLTGVVAFLAVGCGKDTPAPTAKERPIAESPPATSEETQPSAASPRPETPAERAARIHREAVVFDAHCDAVMKAVDEGVDLGVRSDEGHVDFVRMAEGGLDIEVFAMWVEPEYWPDQATQRAQQMLDSLLENFARHPDKIELARTVTEARRITGQGKAAAFLGLEGGHAIEDDKRNLKMFYDKGVRYMTLTWWHNTNWADGSGDKPKWNGLNDLGREIVREMNSLGMVIDVSHASEKTFWDVLEVTTKPIIASHSNTRAIADHHRNLSDEQLRALKANGGVVGINFVPGFLDPKAVEASSKLHQALKPELEAIKKKYKKDPQKSRKERWALWRKRSKELPRVSLDRVIDHIDHVVKIAGIDHVGLGSDFDGFSSGPVGLEDCTDLPLITEKLLERGYSQLDVKKILGENLLRVFEDNSGK